ncbi:ferredoxin [Thermonema lapsum]|jgi:ferredoxin|uniref:Ferredoxin n=1 Tax=Thermonema lapsum TaxID=28195 RepID=A0A846MNM3_9BACT|nr:ferredoxin [Thermonema lapsum]NIK72947.1 ferredoxin [Thermonema lapsum]
MKKKYRVIQYRQKCIGCNACVEVAPERWRMSKKDGKSVLLGAKEKKGIFSVLIHEEELEANRLAAEYCPVNIIRILDT